jgi:hypothetical protein
MRLILLPASSGRKYSSLRAVAGINVAGNQPASAEQTEAAKAPLNGLIATISAMCSQGSGERGAT